MARRKAKRPKAKRPKAKRPKAKRPKVRRDAFGRFAPKAKRPKRDAFGRFAPKAKRPKRDAFGRFAPKVGPAKAAPEREHGKFVPKARASELRIDRKYREINAVLRSACDVLEGVGYDCTVRVHKRARGGVDGEAVTQLEGLEPEALADLLLTLADSGALTPIDGWAIGGLSFSAEELAQKGITYKVRHVVPEGPGRPAAEGNTFYTHPARDLEWVNILLRLEEIAGELAEPGEDEGTIYPIALHLRLHWSELGDRPDRPETR